MEAQTPSTSEDSGRLSEERRKMKLVGEMRETVEKLIGNAGQLQAQSESFNGLGEGRSVLGVDVDLPTLEKLRDILNGHNAEHGTNLEQVKHELRQEFKRQFGERIKDKLRDSVRASLVAQVEVQVEQQLKEHIHVELRQQAEEVKSQLKEVRIALQNSEARMANAYLEATDLYKPLAAILTAEGKASRLFPADMCSLFSYDLETTQALVRDYGLVESEEIEVNVRTFLAHIGAQIDFTKLPPSS